MGVHIIGTPVDEAPIYLIGDLVHCHVQHEVGGLARHGCISVLEAHRIRELSLPTIFEVCCVRIPDKESDLSFNVLQRILRGFWDQGNRF